MKTFVSVVAVLLVLLGAGWLLLPDLMLGRWGVDTDTVGVFVGRRYAATLLGYAVMLWLGRTSGPSPARTAILGGGLVVAAVMTVLSVAGTITGTIGPGGWITVVIEALLAAGFLYYLRADLTHARAGS